MVYMPLQCWSERSFTMIGNMWGKVLKVNMKKNFEQPEILIEMGAKVDDSTTELITTLVCTDLSFPIVLVATTNFPSQIDKGKRPVLGYQSQRQESRSSGSRNEDDRKLDSGDVPTQNCSAAYWERARQALQDETIHLLRVLHAQDSSPSSEKLIIAFRGCVGSRSKAHYN